MSYPQLIELFSILLAIRGEHQYQWPYVLHPSISLCCQAFVYIPLRPLSNKLEIRLCSSIVPAS
jgi:hypothetical protein